MPYHFCSILCHHLILPRRCLVASFSLPHSSDRLSSPILFNRSLYSQDWPLQSTLNPSVRAIFLPHTFDYVLPMLKTLEVFTPIVHRVKSKFLKQQRNQALPGPCCPLHSSLSVHQLNPLSHHQHFLPPLKHTGCLPSLSLCRNSPQGMVNLSFHSQFNDYFLLKGIWHFSTFVLMTHVFFKT